MSSPPLTLSPLFNQLAISRKNNVPIVVPLLYKGEVRTMQVRINTRRHSYEEITCNTGTGSAFLFVWM